MQEFLSLYSNIENPTFEMVVFTYLLAFLLSVLIAATYANTFTQSINTKQEKLQQKTNELNALWSQINTLAQK